MKKEKNNFLMWLFLGLFLIFLWIIYQISKSEQVKCYQDDLKTRRDDLEKLIFEKETFIGYLSNEVEKLKTLNSELVNKAIRFFRLVKISVVVLIVGFGITCYAIFSLNFFEAIGVIMMVATLSFNAVTMVINNKLGDFNLTLQILQDVFIIRQYQKSGFDPLLILTLETRLNIEKAELTNIKKEYNQLLLTEKN